MKKIRKFVCILLLLAVIVWAVSVIMDQKILGESLIRLHVVAQSDSQQDQQVKLQVRDAILQRLQSVMEKMPDVETAKAYLVEHLPEMEQIANQVLQAAGTTARAVVTFAKESFPLRQYDTFSLPAGIYESLRVTIGEGAGKNWWCVVFPGLCYSATTEGFEDTAVGAGFSDRLTGTLTGKKEYQVRFFFLDCLGWMENWLHKL